MRASDRSALAASPALELSLHGDRPDDTRRDGQLTDMPNCMLGAVREAADHRGRELRPSNAAELTERRRIDLSQLLDGRFDASG